MTDFSYYKGFFHDGSVNTAEYIDDSLLFSINSCGLLPKDNKDNLALNSKNQLEGTLFIHKVRLVRINDEEITHQLATSDCAGELLDFNIKSYTVTLGIMRWDEDPVHGWREYFTIEVTGEKIVWKDSCNKTQIDLTGKYL